MASVKQQHYRRLMKEQKTKSTTKSQQRIDHPLAKYNSLNQLSCLVCGIQIKNELLWTTHLHSKKHKDAVLVLKSSKSSSDSQQSQPAPQQKEEGFLKPQAPPTSKRKTSELEGGGVALPNAKKPRQEQQPSSTPSSLAPPTPISADTTDTSYKSTTSKSKHKRSKGKSSSHGNKAPPTTASGLPSDFFDSGVSKAFHGHGEEVYYESSSDSEEEKERTSTVQTSTSGLPSDFFDKTKSSSSATSKEKGNRDVQPPSDKGSLPEGFFDDPKQDAKARKVEYKDPMMEEWEKFQKTIKKEDDISEAIQFEEDEEANEERELTEVNEQVSWFTKAEQLRQKQESIVANRTAATDQSSIHNKSSKFGQQPTTEDSEGSDDELDIDALLDWRSKKS